MGFTRLFIQALHRGFCDSSSLSASTRRGRLSPPKTSAGVIVSLCRDPRSLGASMVGRLLSKGQCSTFRACHGSLHGCGAGACRHVALLLALSVCLRMRPSLCAADSQPANACALLASPGPAHRAGLSLPAPSAVEFQVLGSFLNRVLGS